MDRRVKPGDDGGSWGDAYLDCHAREGGHPVRQVSLISLDVYWVPAFAGTTRGGGWSETVPHVSRTRCSAIALSKTRINAPMALRRRCGTPVSFNCK
jgi:hypothetical protein